MDFLLFSMAMGSFSGLVFLWAEVLESLREQPIDLIRLGIGPKRQPYQAGDHGSSLETLSK